MMNKSIGYKIRFIYSRCQICTKNFCVQISRITLLLVQTCLIFFLHKIRLPHSALSKVFRRLLNLTESPIFHYAFPLFFVDNLAECKQNVRETQDLSCYFKLKYSTHMSVMIFFVFL